MKHNDQTCSKYNDQVLPDENGRCSLCGAELISEKIDLCNKYTKRLNYLRKEIQAERISYSEIEELKSLAKYINQDDTLLREWAGVPEYD